jgi:hypothetical protein
MVVCLSCVQILILTGFVVVFLSYFRLTTSLFFSVETPLLQCPDRYSNVADSLIV